jgi:uroporphyrin-III C-methyltransferase
LAGIPLTLRGVASSAWLGTATGHDGRLTRDLLDALNTSSTLVVFMGRRRLQDIAMHLVQLDKPETPIAVVTEGSLVQQQCHVQTASEWVHADDLASLPDPALLVIGEVVHHQMKSSHSNLRSITPSFTHEYEVPHLPQAGKPHLQRLRRI